MASSGSKEGQDQMDGLAHIVQNHSYGREFEQGWCHYGNVRPRYPDETFREILDFLGDDREVAYDVGTGNGIVIPRLLEAGFKRVEANDLNEPQLVEAKALYGNDPRVRFTVGDATEKNVWIPDASVSLVVCFETVHWFRDKHQDWLREAARILKPGGVVVYAYYVAEETITSNAEANRLYKDFARHITYQDLDKDLLFKCAAGMLHITPPPELFENVKRIFWTELPNNATAFCQDRLAEAPAEWDWWRQALAEADVRPCLMKARHTIEDTKTYFDSIAGVGPALRKNAAWAELCDKIREVTNNDFEVAWPMSLCMARRR